MAFEKDNMRQTANLHYPIKVHTHRNHSISFLPFLSKPEPSLPETFLICSTGGYDCVKIFSF